MRIILSYISWFLCTALLTYYFNPWVALIYATLAIFIIVLYLVINKSWLGLAKQLNHRYILSLVSEIKDYKGFYINFAIRCLMYLLGIAAGYFCKFNM